MVRSSWYDGGYGGVKSPWMRIERVRHHVVEALRWHNELGRDEQPDITLDDVMGPSRVRRIVAARADIMRRLRLDCGWSYPRIGALMQRDHTTVLFQCSPVRHLKTWADRRQWLEYTRQREVAAFRSVAADVEAFEEELERRKLMREQALQRHQMKLAERAELGVSYAAE